MKVLAQLEAAGFKRQNGRPTDPLVAPHWAPIHGKPSLPAGLAWSKHSGHTLARRDVDRDRVMVGWIPKKVLQAEHYQRHQVRLETSWRWVITAVDAARLDALVAEKRERLARAERRRAARRLADVEAVERFRAGRASS